MPAYTPSRITSKKVLVIIYDNKSKMEDVDLVSSAHRADEADRPTGPYANACMEMNAKLSKGDYAP